MASSPCARTRYATVLLAALSLVVALVMAPLSSLRAAADTSPQPPSPETVSADALPTWQLTGVAWAQIVVGDTVYVTGNFTKARPPGIWQGGPGEIDAAHLFAYDIRTGDRIASFNHSLNAQGLAITASPDGSRIYVGGDFTTVDGQVRQHVAAFDTATGALVPSFAPYVNGQVKAVTATNTTVYVGGAFESAAGKARKRLASFQASNGSMNAWAPSAEGGYVWSLLAVPGGSKIIVGGAFQTLSGVTANGHIAVDPVTAQPMTWLANQVIKDYNRGAITSLTTDGTDVYASGFAFGTGGTFEGSFRADASDGRIIWLTDCQGDTYDTKAIGDVVYSVSHAHNCLMIGGFPDTSPRVRWMPALAYTKAATGSNLGPDMYGWNYAGQPAPTLLHWYPALGIGTATGQYQAAWDVEGNGTYVALAGEFPTVNGVAQQGLTRFAVKAAAANTMGPQYDRVPARTPIPTSATTVAPGIVRVSFATAWDKDNERLTYTVVRDKGTAAERTVGSKVVATNFWTLPDQTFVDVSAPDGAHTYTIKITDPHDNALWSTTSQSVNVSGGASAYVSHIVSDGAAHLWRLGEGPGSTIALDMIGAFDGTYYGATLGGAGAIVGDADKSASFSGTTSSYVANSNRLAAPTSVSVEAWVKTTSTRGGKIMGFGSSATGSSATVDRHLYMDPTGRAYFGVLQGTSPKTVRSEPGLNDGKWHHLVGVVSSSGLRIYVDGTLASQDSAVTSAATYQGYWRIAGDRVTGWPGSLLSDWLSGSIDEAAVYYDGLSLAQIQSHYQAGGGATVNQPPTAAFISTVTGLQVAVDGAGSADADGSIVSYAWDFGDGQSGTGVTASHTYAAAGTFAVKLTVTDDKGATGTVTKNVNVAAAPVGPLAFDAFERSLATGWGTAETGGAWLLSGSSSLFSVAGGAGNIRNAAGAGPAVSLTAVAALSVNAETSFAIDKLPNSGSFYLNLFGRGNHVNGYSARATVSASGSVGLSLNKTVNLVESSLTGRAVAGLTYAPGSRLVMRIVIDGAGPTSLRGRIWAAGTPEPSTWTIVASDSEPGLQAAGPVGLRVYTSSTATNGPVTVAVDDFKAVPL